MRYYDRAGPPGSAALASAAQVGQPAGEQGDMPYITGLFSRANEWARIESRAEGRFLERFAPGAFSRTIREHRRRIRILYDHGSDGFIGRRPIAPLDGIGEDGRGAFFFGKLFDTIGARELVPLLAAGVLGSSFRFGTVRAQEVDRPARSDYNVERLPERTVLEAELIEVGPTPFPIYSGSTAGVTNGGHPPRSEPAKPDPEWMRFLVAPPYDSEAERVARQRWLDRIMPLPSRT